jgi:sulfatase maturation enzyme AslB (radical SAM superfamily)
MGWHCPAIDHGVTIFPDGKIRPCCQAASEYSKPLSHIAISNRFEDLKSLDRPDACKKCWEQEDQGLPSYRQWFLSMHAAHDSGIKFLDFRHSNQCNLKCRYCGPHFSNQWAKELAHDKTLLKSDIAQHLDSILTQDLIDVYWCGGEPLMMKDHYDVLSRCINLDISKNINLRYNTNLMLIDYKHIDITELWTKFKTVSVSVSIDAIGIPLDLIRSGSKWNIIQSNIDRLINIGQTCDNVKITFAPTVSMLNVWFLPELFGYAREKNIPVQINLLTGPDYLSLDAIHPRLQNLARQKIDAVKSFIPQGLYQSMMRMLSRDDNQELFLHAIRHILLLDYIRQENLFDILPYRDLAIDLTVRNYEYQ